MPSPSCRIVQPVCSTVVNDLPRRCLAEFTGTALLVGAVIGSGIMASQSSPADTGLQLLENTAATAAILVVVILLFGPVSGAHVNPVVTLADRLLGRRSTVEAVAYIGSQLAGGAAGAVIANLMFSLPAVTLSVHERTGSGLWLGEVVATLGLVLLVFGLLRNGNERAVPYAVACYIASAYWFTSSTSFANPAVTVARTLSDTFAGISPSSAPAFVACQLVGGALGLGLLVAIFPRRSVHARPPDGGAA